MAGKCTISYHTNDERSEPHIALADRSFLRPLCKLRRRMCIIFIRIQRCLSVGYVRQPQEILHMLPSWKSSGYELCRVMKSEPGRLKVNGVSRLLILWTHVK